MLCSRAFFDTLLTFQLSVAPTTNSPGSSPHQLWPWWKFFHDGKGIGVFPPITFWSAIPHVWQGTVGRGRDLWSLLNVKGKFSKVFCFLAGKKSALQHGKDCSILALGNLEGRKAVKCFLGITEFFLSIQIWKEKPCLGCMKVMSLGISCCLALPAIDEQETVRFFKTVQQHQTAKIQCILIFNIEIIKQMVSSSRCGKM